MSSVQVHSIGCYTVHVYRSYRSITQLAKLYVNINIASFDRWKM